MAKVKQGISIKKKAIRKDNKAKYQITTKKSVTQLYENDRLVNKYGYGRKINKLSSTKKYSYKG